MKRLALLALLAVGLSGCGSGYQEQMARIATAQVGVHVPYGWVRFCDYKACWLVADPNVWDCAPPTDRKP